MQCCLVSSSLGDGGTATHWNRLHPVWALRTKMSGELASFSSFLPSTHPGGSKICPSTWSNQVTPYVPSPKLNAPPCLASFHYSLITYLQDFAFQLGSQTFKWRWDANYLGPKLSADILSKQLIMPLISVVHLAFSSPSGVTDMSDNALEQVSTDLSAIGFDLTSSLQYLFTITGCG